MKKHFQTIWIVGASAGIGAALAAKFANNPTSEQQNIIISARNGDKLRELADALPGVIPVAVDITDPNAVKSALARIEEEFGLPDLAVLAAGIYSPMKVANFSADTVRSHIDTNYIGIVNCLEPLLTRMRAPVRGNCCGGVGCGISRIAQCGGLWPDQGRTDQFVRDIAHRIVG